MQHHIELSIPVIWIRIYHVCQRFSKLVLGISERFPRKVLIPK